MLDDLGRLDLAEATDQGMCMCLFHVTWASSQLHGDWTLTQKLRAPDSVPDNKAQTALAQKSQSIAFAKRY